MVSHLSYDVVRGRWARISRILRCISRFTHQRTTFLRNFTINHTYSVNSNRCDISDVFIYNYVVFAKLQGNCKISQTTTNHRKTSENKKL